MSSSKETVSTKQERIARNAKSLPEVSFTSIAYHIDGEWMHEAYRKVRKDGAAGVDGQTGTEYQKELDANLSDLLNRIKSGRYIAPPVKRGYVPKNETEKRPIGIPTFEDKVAQRAIHMALEPLYEQDFYDFSFGFRPGKSQHMALDRLWNDIMNMKGAYLVDLDISKYFDSIDHKLLRAVLQKRVKDGIVMRMIGKWLNAGVMEQGRLSRPGKGSPQGGVISPLLSNIYLHEVLDSWFVKEVKPRLNGKASMVRFADDAVLVFEREDDLVRVMKVLPRRFEKYGLKMNETKTKIRRFTPPTDGRKPDTFQFLGFLHYWGKSRKGSWVVKRKTDTTRLSRMLKAIALWCREHRHDPLSDQQRMLNLKLKGHYQYYGITPNSRSIGFFWENVKRIWMKWLNRRSRNPHLNWDKFNLLLQRYPLVTPKIYHSFV